MNDAPPSISSIDEAGPSSNAPIPDEHAAPPAEDDAEPVQEKKKRQRNQKAVFLDHLIRNVDIMVYCQLSIVHYMDCSFLTFLLRAIPHWFYFTPKPAIFPSPPASVRGRPYIGIIVGANTICFLLHLIFSPPAAGEATRGYLHGGMLIDFVGQQSPVGRWRLCGLDLLVLILQLAILAVILERNGLKTGEEAGENTSDPAVESRQDHDAEERGVIRRDSNGLENIELQDLHHPSGRTGGDEDRERDELLQAGANYEQEAQHALDSFYTGNHVIVNIRILEVIRAQWKTSSASSGVAASGAQAAEVDTIAGRISAFRRLREGIQV